MKLTRLTIPLVYAMFLYACQPQAEKSTEQLDTTSLSTVEESPDEWIMLFDGSDVSHWKTYNEDGLEWQVVNGELTTDGTGGDIMSKEKFTDFELEFDWKISRGGNSGVLYQVVEDKKYKYSHETGPEYQLIDAENYEEVHNYKLEPTQVTAANYALGVPSSQPVNPSGEYNHSKIVVNQGRVEHWLNGVKVLEYELWTPVWEQKVASTKFKDMPDYGKAKSGHIALQGHGDQVWFKEIKIKNL